MVMKLTVLVIITALGIMIPLLWITGTLTSIVYFIRHREKITREEAAFTLDPHLGLTMADGGDPMDEKGKKSTANKLVSMTGTSQAFLKQTKQKPVSSKMFWWGGYF
jgi:hypothetical protein